jgi:cytochrome P450
MTPKLIHENEVIFPAPFLFNPERWDIKDAASLKKYIGTFSKGGRDCLGRQ